MEQNQVAAPSEGAQNQQTTPQPNQAPAVDPKAQPANEDQNNFASRFADLSRREKSLYQLDKEIKEQQKVLEAQREEYQNYLNLKNKAKLNPDEYIKHAGLSYEDLTSFYLNDQKPNPDAKVDMLHQEINGLKKLLEEKEEGINKRFEEEQAKKNKLIVDSFKNQIKSHIISNKDKYEILDSMDAIDNVYDLVHESYNKTGEILPIDKACEEYEKFMFNELSKYVKLNKFKSLLNDKTDGKSQGQTQTTNTLTNSTTINQPMPSNNVNQLSDEDRFEEAKRILKASFIKE